MSIDEREILNVYAKIYFYFEKNMLYVEDFGYPLHTLEHFKTRIDINYLRKYSLQDCSIFFLYLMSTYKHNLPRAEINLLIKSSDFKKYKESLINYEQTLYNDFDLVYNAKTLDNLKKLLFTKKISPITFYIIVKVFYKDDIVGISSSNMYQELWNTTSKVARFMNLNKDVIKTYIQKFRN